MKGILKKLSIAAAMLVLCTGLAACGQTGQEAQSGTGGMTGTEGQTVSGNPGEQTASGNPGDQTASGNPGTEGTKLVILHTNDMHGYMQASDTCLGIVAVAQLKKDYQQQGYDVLLMDAGDYLQGSSFASFTQGESVVEVMNAAGYDVAALGNHEFDYGSDVLEKRISEMNFPAVAANITVDATGEPFIQQNAVFTLSDGTKVGVFGLDTPSTATTSVPKNTAGLTFAKEGELYAAAQAQIDELKGQDCSIIVCVGHLGEEASNEGNNAENVVANTSGLTVMIDGHDHLVENQTVKDKEGNDVLIAETGYYLKNIGVLTYENGKFTDSLVEVGTYTGSDPELEKMVAEETAEIEATMQEVVAVTDFELYGEAAPGNRTQETTMGDLASDAMYWQVTQAAGSAPDAVVLNGGAIRASIKAGEIKLLDIHNVFPFNNQLCTVEVTGAQLLEALEAATQSSPDPMGAFPQVYGIKYTLDTTVPYEKGELYPGTTYNAPAAPGSRITIHEVAGKEFDPEATYTIATNEFVATGGDTYYCFAEAGATTMVYVGYLDYEALLNYMKTELEGTIPEIYEEVQGRITVVGE
ncbi:MAG: bifunctional metallophosphatase/5'-nucleotidase [Lachnospiraceae bacterium]|nr:bifunctional metallophosphatase/5'-nucleotidase [Lachnospiraceae bacterium]